MATPTVETVECDILIIGGGMSGCGAAFWDTLFTRLGATGSKTVKLKPSDKNC